MAKDIIVSINVANGEIYTNSSLLGVSGENVEGQIIVEFFNGDFVDGACNFEIEKADGTKGYLAMTKDTASKIYRLDISANLLSVVGKLKAQVHITQIKKGTEIPVFKSQVFTLDVLDALNTAETIPADKAEWCDKVDEKLEALDKSISEMPNDFFEKPTDNPTEDSLLKVSSTGSTSWQHVSDFLARPTSAANSDRVCIIPDGQTKFSYRNAYKTVYNVENVMVIRDVRGTVPQPDPQREQDGVNLRYLQANYNGNPTLDGTEAELTGVTLNGTKYKVPSGGGSGAGLDTLTDVNLTSSGTTVAYDIASGVTVSSNGKFTYEGGEKDATTKVNVPIVAGKGIKIAKVADKEQVEVKVDIADAAAIPYDDWHNGNIYIPFKSGAQNTSIGIGSKPSDDNYYGIQIGLNTYSNSYGTAVGGYAVCGCVGVAIGHSTINKYNRSKPSEQNGKVTVGAYLQNDTDGCIVLGTGNEATTAEDRFILADGNGYNINQRHTYFKIIKEIVDNVAKYTAYLNDKKLLTEDEGLSKPSGNPTEDSVVKVSSTGTVSYLGIDTTATSASANLVTSGAVAAVESSLSQSIAGCATEPDVSTFPENDDAFFIGEKTSHASKWLPKKQMTLKSHKIHFDAFDSGSTVGQYDDAFISVLCYTETHFTVDTLMVFMLATGQSYPVCSPSYGMVGYVRVSNAAGEITWEDKDGNNITLAGINENSYVVTDIQSFFPFDE